MPRHLHRARLALGAILMAALGIAAPPPVFAAPGGARSAASAPPATPFSAEAVKAAYLVNFIRFTDWPAGVPAADSPYVIGISGNRALEDELIRLADRQLIRDHRLRIVRLRNLRDLDGVHLAFFDSAAETHFDVLPAAEALPLLRQRPVLTVSDTPGFLPMGGIINLYREEAALRFEIAPEAARDAGLAVNSRLLALARIYRPDATPPPLPAPAP